MGCTRRGIRGCFAGNPEGVNDINFLPQTRASGCRNISQLALGVGCQDAAGIEQQVADQANRFTRSGARYGKNVAVILDANELLPQCTDQDFFPGWRGSYDSVRLAAMSSSFIHRA